MYVIQQAAYMTAGMEKGLQCLLVIFKKLPAGNDLQFFNKKGEKPIINLLYFIYSDVKILINNKTGAIVPFSGF